MRQFNACIDNNYYTNGITFFVQSPEHSPAMAYSSRCGGMSMLGDT